MVTVLGSSTWVLVSPLNKSNMMVKWAEMFVVYTHAAIVGNKWIKLKVRISRADAMAIREEWLKSGEMDDGAIRQGFPSFR